MTDRDRDINIIIRALRKFGCNGIERENLDASWFNNVSYYLNNKKNINVVAGGYWQSCWYDALDKYFIGG